MSLMKETKFKINGKSFSYMGMSLKEARKEAKEMIESTENVKWSRLCMFRDSKYYVEECNEIIYKQNKEETMQTKLTSDIVFSALRTLQKLQDHNIFNEDMNTQELSEQDREAMGNISEFTFILEQNINGLGHSLLTKERNGKIPMKKTRKENQ